jgi:hypothetical protein
VDAAPAVRPEESVNDGNLPGILQAAIRRDLVVSPERRAEILARAAGIQTRAQAMQYLAEVQQRLRPTPQQLPRNAAG